ncbi:MAG: peptidylprolyl isomerase [Methanomicrobiales archaeon]|nr:peptidylprolyl isomerase [Methanomicrobiales archaeon]
MTIAKGDVIRLHYTGDINGKIFDTTDERIAKEADIFNESATYGPITICVGNKHVVLGLDEALEGAEMGSETTIEVPPGKAFGAHEDTLVESIPLTKFREPPQVGGRVQIENREGVVINRIGRRAVVDFNHPLSGKTVRYTFTILEKVESTDDKVKGVIRLYTQREMEVSYNEGVVSITLPAGIQYERRWHLWRGKVISDIFATMSEVNEIILLEIFKRPVEENVTAKSDQ